MDVQKKLDEIVESVSSARSMPMSASCVVNRAELLAMLEEVRQALPDSLAQARELIGGREQLVEEARQEAERIIQSAHAERGSLISDTQVARQSRDQADRILAEARREAEEIRAEADDYVDSKLANFEVVLTKTIGSVDRGREKLLGRGNALSGGYDADADADAPEYSADPATLIQRADDYVDAKLGAFEAVLSKTLEAVGRGRQKLHGRIATDELGAHIAAQDAAGAPRHSSDADYLAGLAELADPDPQAQQAQAQQTPQAQPQQPQGQPLQPGIPQQPDPYTYPPQDAYAYQQDPYAAYQQQPAQTGQADYGQGYASQQPAYGYQQQPQTQPALDETSFFDTSMIDLDQLRRYEEGR
ncbi:ATP synthase F0 subunit B [Streptomyces sp. PR69]|uniref:ATP synthase F0 subunit B n=1 Tax=Streptomyces sp. PR69 TaxID=2984950 RepID=UPI0022647AED|nr:cell division initiation protein [Streptomyces sp. PR69]